MSITIFLMTLLILATFYGFLSYIAAQKVTNIQDYFLAGRNLGLAPVTFTLIATQLGGGMLLGTAQQAYTVGFYGLFYTIGMSIGFLLLGSGIAGRLRDLNVVTTAQIFQTKYNSINLRKFASFLSIITLCGLLIGQIVASKTLLAGLGITNELLFLLLWAFIIIYTVIGGLQALVVIDSFQVLYIILIFSSLFIFALLQESVPLIESTMQLQTQFAALPIRFSHVVSVLLMPILFAVIEQDLAQRFFAARTKKIAVMAALISSAFMLFFSFIPLYFGMKTKLINLTLLAGANPLIAYIEWILPKALVAFVIIGVLAAITSTADSLLCAISSNLAQDFDFSFIGIKNKLTISQGVTFIVGLGTLITSYFMPIDIIYILIESYALSVCCLFVPLIIAYYKKDCNKNAAIGAVAFGLFGFIIFQIKPIGLPHQIAALVLSLIGYALGSFIRHSQR